MGPRMAFAGDQARVWKIVGLGMVVCSIPVLINSFIGYEEDPKVAEKKKKSRQERLAWIQSDEMPAD